MDPSRRLWLLFFSYLALGRLITAWFHGAPAHADEWFQTLEFSRILRGLDAYSTQEVALHLRNLTWPSILAVWGAFLDLAVPARPLLQFSLFHVLAALLNAGLIWGVAVTLRQEGLSPRAQLWALALLFLPLYTWQDNIRLSIEHASSIAFWLGVGLHRTNRPASAGFFLALTGALRYPSGLLPVGYLLGLLVERKTDPRTWARLALGALSGVIAGGLADGRGYGIPYESLARYADYNILSGKAAAVFGAQPLSTYLEWWSYRWIQKILWVPLIPLFFAGFGLRLRAWNGWKHPLFWACLLYLAGHALVSHKEPRFMACVDLPLLVLALPPVLQWLDTSVRWRLAFQRALLVLIVINAFPSLKVWRGNAGTPERALVAALGQLAPGRSFEKVCSVYVENRDPGNRMQNHLSSRLPGTLPYRVHFFHPETNEAHAIVSAEPCEGERNQALVFTHERAAPEGCSPYELGSTPGSWHLCPDYAPGLQALVRESPPRSILTPRRLSFR